MAHRIATLVLFMLFVSCTLAIHSCGHKSFDRRTPEEIAAIDGMRATLIESGKRHIEHALQSRDTGSVLRIPVVWHVLHDVSIPGSEVTVANIEADMEFLNQWFSATNLYYDSTSALWDDERAVGTDFSITFELASFDPSGASTTGIEYRDTSTAIDCNFNDDIFVSASGGLDSWNTLHYMNVYTCSFNTTQLGGYAALPGLSPRPSDAMVLGYNFIGDQSNAGGLIGHEMGHWLGLVHTFQDCASTDFMDDTPPTDAPASSYVIPAQRCPGIGGATDQTFLSACDGSPVMVQNIMDYNFDDCVTLFSKDQAALMRGFLLSGTVRSQLSSSPGLSATCPGYDCTDKNCGSDGCDGSCGECGAFSSCVAQVCTVDTPVNQECDTAMSIAPVAGQTIQVTGDNTGASSSAAPFNACMGFPLLNTLWYSFTAPADGLYNFNSFFPSNQIDTEISIWSGACEDPATCLAYNDEAPERTYVSSLDVELTAGNPYLMAISGWGGAQGFFIIDITAPGGDPVGDLTISGTANTDCDCNGSSDDVIEGTVTLFLDGSEVDVATLSSGAFEFNELSAGSYMVCLDDESLVFCSDGTRCVTVEAPSTTVSFAVEFVPVLTAPADITVDCISCYTPACLPAFETVCGGDDVPVTTATDDSSTDCPIVITRTFTTDNGVATQVITVTDNDSPALIQGAAPVFEPCTSTLSTAYNDWLADNGDMIAEDACGEVEYTNDGNPALEFTACSGTQLVSFTASDPCGNSVASIGEFTVTSTIAIATQPQSMTVECPLSYTGDAYADWLASGGNMVVDSCDATITFSNNAPASPQEGCSESTPVIFTATDSCGNSIDSESVDFVVEDTTPPAFETVPDPESAPCNEGVGTSFDNWVASATGAFDVCGDSTIENDFEGDLACGQSYTVGFFAVDECGNESPTLESTFTVLSVGAGPPVITEEAQDENTSCASDVDLAFTTWVDAQGGADVSISEGCGDLVWTSDAVSAPQNPNGLCSVDAVVTFTATDDCGSVSTTATFTMANDALEFQIASETTVECSVDNEAQYADFLETAAANTGTYCVATFSNNAPELAEGCDTTVVEFTVTNGCDGTSIVDSTSFTIEDTIAPIFAVAPSGMTGECGDEGEYITWLDANGGAELEEDACSSATISKLVIDEDSDPCSGSVTVEFTATEDCGASTSAQAVYTVQDTVAPLFITMPSEFSGDCTDFQEWLDSNGGAEASDDCNSEGLVFSNDFEDNFGSFDSACTDGMVTFSVADVCGLSTTATVPFNGNTLAPVFVVEPTDLEVDCFAAEGLLEQWLNNNGGASASYACGDVSFSNSESASGSCPDTAVYTFTACGDCNNCVTSQATYTEFNNGPELVSEPVPFEQECASQEDIDAWIAAVEAIETDDCGGATISVSGDVLVPSVCSSGSQAFAAVDNCGNTFDFEVEYNIPASSSVEFISDAQDASFSCDELLNEDQFASWMENFGGAELSPGICGVELLPVENIEPISCGTSVQVTFEAFACGESTGITSSATFTVDPLTVITPVALQNWPLYQFLCIEWDVEEIDLEVDQLANVFVLFGEDLSSKFAIARNVDLSAGKAEILLYGISPGVARTQMIYKTSKHVEMSPLINILPPTGEFPDPCP